MYGFDIHMSGYQSGKPLTKLSKLFDESKESSLQLLASTVFSNGKRQLVIGSDDEISIVSCPNGMYIVLIHTEAFTTAMLCDKTGYGVPACFTTEFDGYCNELSDSLIIKHNEVLYGNSIDSITDKDIAEELNLSIKRAFKIMDEKDRWAKSKLGDRYNDIVGKYL